MSKKLKWTLSILAAVLLLMLAFVVAGPWLAVNGIRNVIAAGQYGELWRFVDFERLRESLAPQIQSKIASGIVDRVGRGQTAEAVGEVTAMIAQPAIDAMVSPTGVATLLHGSALSRSIAGATNEDGKPRAVDPLKDASTGYQSFSLFTATVLNAEGQPVVFEFSRYGLAWKLTGIRLPEQ